MLLAEALSVDDPGVHGQRVDAVLDQLLLLRDPQQRAFFRAINLELDDSTFATASQLQHGGAAHAVAFVVSVELYHALTAELLGIAQIDGEQPAALGVRTVWEALPFVPGLQAELDSRGSATLTARGIPFNSNSGSVQILLNSVPIAREEPGAKRLSFLPTDRAG